MNIQLQLSTLNQRRPQGGDEVLAAKQCAAALKQCADSAQGFFYGTSSTPSSLFCIKALQSAVVSFVGGFITLCPDVLALLNVGIQPGICGISLGCSLKT